MDEYLWQRQQMVERQIRSRGVSDERVLAAMVTVPREKFVPGYDKSSCYHDGPLSIGYGQTISQPYIVAYMTELLNLQGHERVLELGTGSGYQTAVLAEIAAEVYTIEVIETLGKQAKERLTDTLGYTNIHFKIANGREGWSQFAPFDRILLTAAAAQFPPALFEQLAVGGLVVAPVGDYYQQLIRYQKSNDGIHAENLIAVAFVPFV